MLRIRRFEERCVELYSAAKIRGFLHLYIGEEAVAVGVMARRSRADDAVVATYREHGHALARGDAAPRVMAEMFGKVERLQPRTRRLDAPLRRRPPLLRRQRDRRRRPADGRRPGAGGPDAGARPGDRLLLRRGGRGRGRVPRVHEPRGAVAAAGAVLLREQPVRHGHGARAVRSRRRTSRSRRRATRCPAWRSTAWTSWRSPDAAAARCDAIRGGRWPVLPRAPDLPLPRPLDVRPRALPREGRGRAVEGARPDRRPFACAQLGALDDADARRRSRPRSPPRSRTRSRSPRRRPTSRSSDLQRFVYEPDRLGSRRR